MTSSDSYDVLVRSYAGHARRYDRRWARYNEATLSRAEQLVTNHARRPVAMLDVACGTGLLAERIRRRFPNLIITGVDVSEEMLALARRKFADDRRAEWLVARAESLPVESDRYDVVTCTNAFHLFRHQSDALAEFRRVLAPGGVLVLVDWDRHYPTMRLLSAFYRVFGHHRRHIHDLAEARSMLDAADFDLEEAESYRATTFWGMIAAAARKPVPVPAQASPDEENRVERPAQRAAPPSTATPLGYSSTGSTGQARRS